MSSSRPLVRGWKLILASTVIFASWVATFGLFLHRQAVNAGQAIDLRTIAQLKPPTEWQFSVAEQAGTPVGYSWEHLQEVDVEGRTRYELTERSKLRATVGETATDTALQFVGQVDDRFRLISFRGSARLGSFEYGLRGTVAGRTLTLDLSGPEGAQHQTVALNDDLYLPLTALPYLANASLTPGNTYTLEAFNPVSLGKQTVRVRVLGKEPKPLRDHSVLTTKLEITLAGVTTNLYVSDRGERVLEETPDGSIVSRAATQEETLRVDRTLNIPTPKLPPP